MKSLINQFGGKWVALKPNSNKVISSGTNAKKVVSEAHKKGIKIPTLFRVPERYVPYIG